MAVPITPMALYLGYEYLFILALIASVALVALLYMIGKALSDERLEAYAKSELSQIFFSVIIVLLVLFAAGGADAWAGTIANMDPQAQICQYTNEPCHFALARNHLDIVFNTAEDMTAKLIWMNSLFLFVSELRFGLRLTIAPWGDLGLAPFSGMGTLTEALNFAVDLLVKIMIASRFQQYLLDIIRTALFPIFLIGGFFLRNFFLTRKLGGLLLAMGVCLYFVFPFMYALAGLVLYTTTGQTDNIMLFRGEEGTILYKLELPTTTAIDPLTGQPVQTTMIDPLTGEPMQAPPAGIYTLDEQALQDYIPKMRQLQLFDPGATPPYLEDTLTILFTAAKDFITSIPKVVVAIPNAIYQSLTAVSNSSDGGWLLGKSGIFAGIAKLMLYSVLMPFIAIMTTLSAIKTLSPLLGGDVEIAGLTRLI